ARHRADRADGLRGRPGKGRPVSGDPNALDAAALGPYLEAHVEGFRGLEHIEKFKSGQSNPTYLLHAASGRYVLRAKPPGQLLKSARQVDRECAVLKALAGTTAPGPRVRHRTGEGEASRIGRRFYVMAYADGRVLRGPALSAIGSDAERSAIDDAMNATLAAPRAVD